MNKGIKRKVSKTARVTRFTRAMSYYDKNKYYRSNDYIAPALLSPRYRIIVKNRITHYIYQKRFGSSGAYEYVVARTKLIDGIFESLPGNIQQVVICGAGFDTRAVRFKDSLSNTVVYELDAPLIQQSKINGYRKAKIALPSNLKFIPIDFSGESLPHKLEAAGFQKDVPGFYLLEGLTIYLTQDSIDSTFGFLGEYSGKGSRVVFDYIYASVLRCENIYYGEKRCYEYARAHGEQFSFGIEKGRIKDFLSGYNFKLIDEYDSDKLESKYFTDEAGKKIGRMGGIYNVVIAEKV